MTDYFAFLEDQPPVAPTLEPTQPRSPGAGLHPYAEAIRLAWLGRLTSLTRPWVKGASWDSGCFVTARKLIELANSPWSGYSRSSAHEDYMAAAPSDAKWDGREKCWTQAEKATGSAGLPEPPERLMLYRIEEVDAAALGWIADEEAEAADALGSSWLPLDLTETIAGLVAGTLVRPQPTVGRLPNGDALFYPGRVNGIHGDSTSGKTWTALTVAREQLTQGERVLYVDLEDNEAGIIGRLLDMGVDPAVLVKGFDYVRPYDPCDAIALGLLLGTVEQTRPSLVIIDTTGEALALQGINPNADEEVATWMRRIARRIADLGPAVVLLDHIPKSSDGATPLQPIGSQRKRAAISGAQYAQDCRESFSRDMDGYSRLRCGKDRGGNYSTGQHLADLRIGPSVPGVAQLETPADVTAFRPTALMARVSAWLADNPGASQNAIVGAVPGKAAHIRAAIRALVSEGYIRADRRGQGFAHSNVSVYFEERG